MDWILLLTSMLVPLVPLFFFPACACCPICSSCTSSPAASVQVDIAGLTNDSCTNCNALNATYILPVSSLFQCFWTVDIPTVCTVTTVTIELEQTGSWVDFIMYAGGSRRKLWRSSAAGYNSCQWSSFPLTVGFVPGTCNDTSSTCHLTSL